MDNEKLSICTNTDTGLLKVIAFASMLIDHVGYIFFPSAMWLRIIGRLGFPLFAYCVAAGFVYTRSVKKYALRHLAFGVVSQPFYTLANYPESVGRLFDPLNYGDFWVALVNLNENLHLNIGFTLLLGLLALYGIREKKYWCTALSALFSLSPAFEYSFYGVGLIIVIYSFFKSSRDSFGIIVGIFLFAPFIVGNRFYNFLGFNIDPQGFAILALPLMLMRTNAKIKIPRLLNYGFYPIHLAVLYLINQFLQRGF